MKNPPAMIRGVLNSFTGRLRRDEQAPRDSRGVTSSRTHDFIDNGRQRGLVDESISTTDADPTGQLYKTLTALASYNDGPDASSNSGAKRGNKSSTKRVDRERRTRRVGANRPPDRHLRQQHLKYDIAFKLIVASQERRD